MWLCITDSNPFKCNGILGNFGLYWWVPEGRNICLQFKMINNDIETRIIFSYFVQFMPVESNKILTNIHIYTCIYIYIKIYTNDAIVKAFVVLNRIIWKADMSLLWIGHETVLSKACNYVTNACNYITLYYCHCIHTMHVSMIPYFFISCGERDMSLQFQNYTFTKDVVEFLWTHFSWIILEIFKDNYS